MPRPPDRAEAEAKADAEPDPQSGPEQRRIAELEERVSLLEAAMGLDADFTVPEQVRANALAGRRVQAVRELRRSMRGRLGLLAATRMVDVLAGRDQPS